MHAFRIFAFTIGIALPDMTLALSCQVTPFDEIAVLPNTQDRMMVLGQVDENFVFDGFVVGPSEPIRLQMTEQFRDPPHPIWGGPTLPTNSPVLGPVVRVDENRFQFIGSLCGLLLLTPTDAVIDRVRQCQRDGVCPE